MSDFFDDPRRRQSEEHAFDAERAERAGDLAAARAKYAAAARLEQEVAMQVPASAARVRSVLAISAVALWLRGEAWGDAATAACAFLAQPDLLTPQGRTDLRVLLDRAWRTEEIERAVGRDGSYASLETRLSGGLVRGALAPAVVVAERRVVLPPMLLRTAEWKTGRQYRKAGPSALAASYVVYEAPALAASYGIRLYVGTSNQQTIQGGTPRPQEVIDWFLEIAASAAAGPEALARLISDERYARAFLRGFRDLAPDGGVVGEVSFSSNVGGRPSVRTTLAPSSRGELTRALAAEEGARDMSRDGVLKSINLRGSAPSIHIEVGPQTVQRFRLRKGEHDDTIGPKLNRRVRVVGAVKRRPDGEEENWAHDVLVIEPPGQARPDEAQNA